MAGNPSAMAAIMSAMPDQYRVSSGNGGGSTLASLLNGLEDDYAKERYKSQLDVWEKDKQHEFDASQARSLGQVTDRLYEQFKAKPNLSVDEASQLEMMHTLGQSGLASALPVLQEMIKNSSGAYTNNMQKPDDILKYEAAQRDPALAQFLKQQGSSNVPSPIQVANMLSDPSVSDEYKQNLRWASKIEKNIGNVEDAAAANARGKEGTEAVIKQYDAMPKTFQQYEKLKTGFESTSQLIAETRKLLQDSPQAAGWGHLLEELPETEASRLRTLLSSIKSNISLQTLQDLKASSPTGATGFGALSEGELRIITDLLGSLDNINTPGQIIDTLNGVESRLGNVAASAFQSIDRDKEWFEQNKYHAPALYDRLKKGFDLLQPPAPHHTAPSSVPRINATDSVTKARGQLQGRGTLEEQAAEEIARRNAARR